MGRTPKGYRAPPIKSWSRKAYLFGSWGLCMNSSNFMIDGKLRSLDFRRCETAESIHLWHWILSAPYVDGIEFRITEHLRMVECTSVYTPAARRSLTGHTLFSRRLRDTYTALRKDFPASDEDPQIKEYWSLADPRFGLQTPLSQISSMRFHTFSPRSPWPFTSLEIVKHGLRDLAVTKDL